MDDDHVACRLAPALLHREIGIGVVNLAQEVVDARSALPAPGRSRRGSTQCPPWRGARRRLLGGPGDEVAIRADEGLGAVECVEERDESFNVLGRGRFCPTPMANPSPMTQAAHLVEDLEGARRTQPDDLLGDGVVQVVEVALDLGVAEQRLRVVAAPQEQFNGHLGLDQCVGGHAEAGLLLRLGIERADARIREDAEQPMPECVHHESVAVPGPLPNHEAGRVRRSPAPPADPGHGTR